MTVAYKYSLEKITNTFFLDNLCGFFGPIHPQQICLQSLPRGVMEPSLLAPRFFEPPVLCDHGISTMPHIHMSSSPPSSTSSLSLCIQHFLFLYSSERLTQHVFIPSLGSACIQRRDGVITRNMQLCG